jgi:hypothetical protein
MAMTDKGMMLLQNCLESQEDVQELHSEARPTSPSHNGNQSVNIKSEEFSDVEVGEDPVPITFVDIKAEYDVSGLSLVCPLLHISESHPDLPFLFLSSASVTQYFSSQ